MGPVQLDAKALAELNKGNLVHLGPIDNRSDAFLIGAAKAATWSTNECLPYSWIDFKGGAIAELTFTNVPGIMHLVIQRGRHNTDDSNHGDDNTDDDGGPNSG